MQRLGLNPVNFGVSPALRFGTIFEFKGSPTMLAPLVKRVEDVLRLEKSVAAKTYQTQDSVVVKTSRTHGQWKEYFAVASVLYDCLPSTQGDGVVQQLLALWQGPREERREERFELDLTHIESVKRNLPPVRPLITHHHRCSTVA